MARRFNLTMQKFWITSAAGRKAISYLTDPRPTWLWSADGKRLLWHNVAARLVGAKAKRHKIKRQALMQPIKGQVARLLRFGTVNQSSLSRMQFIRGTKPVSATCTCTPLALDSGKLALLIVGVDPISTEVLERVGMNSDDISALFGPDYSFTLFDVDGMPIAADPEHATPAQMPEGGSVLPAGPHGETISIAKHAETSVEDETPQTPRLPDDDTGTDDSGAEKNNGVGVYKNLTQLLDRLSEDENLFAPLGPQEDDELAIEDDEAGLWVEAEEPASHHVEPRAPQDDANAPQSATWEEVVAEGQQFETEGAREDITAFEQAQEADLVTELPEDDIEKTDGPTLPAEDADLSETPTSAQDDTAHAYWQIVGRGFESKTPPQETVPPSGVVEGSEQSTRYNFAELSRILNERIAGERAEARTPTAPIATLADETPNAQRGALFNLSDESLVLNRLPLGLLIFRDQKILFANRAMTDLVGYDDSVTLRAQGLDAIFPRLEERGENVGPVTQLSHRNGVRVPVSARLQAINWQGSPALMLTAKTQTSTPGVEGAVRSFAEQLAALEGNGYFETSRAGIITSVSGQAADMFGRTPPTLIGRPLLLLVDHNESPALRKFLEEAARRAETSRPAIALKGLHENLRVLLFAEGQAGYVTGYFGVVQNIGSTDGEAVVPAESEKSRLDPAILERLSRGMRRPLNTIIGFSELVGSSAFGPIENQRYVEYARDIKSAGQEIVYAVDEIEELSRIDNGNYDVRPIEFDLATLLHECIGKVRAPAGRARVFVRSAISENLPHIRADRPSLAQAILNLVASAINQSHPGNHVVLSAQQEDDGSVAIHVRSSTNVGLDVAEHFVVYREDAPQLGQAAASSVGLALTRSLLAINTCTLSIESGMGQGSLLSLFIPAQLAAPSQHLQ